MAFSPCLSRKRPSHGLCPHLRWPFPSACRGKGRIVDALASLRLPFPSQGEGKGQFQVSSASPQRGLERTPKVARELPSQKTINFDYFRLLKSVDLSRFENTKKWGGSGHEMFMDSACACDDLFPLPVKGKAVLWTWCAFAMAFPPCLSRKRPFHGLGSRLRLPFPPACRGKGRLMDFGRVCDGLFPLPVEEKAVSWTWCVLAIGFSPCLSRKR